jgi:5-methylcytosine-specific restriction endonuclease McrA
MSRNVTASGPAVNGRRIAAFMRAVVGTYGSLCHLCGLPGADSIDHLKPIKTHPELRWDIDNVRPAHRSCNSARGAAALVLTYRAASW